MNEPQAYLDGTYLPAHEAVLPVWDHGFAMGTTIVEQLRTFNGKLFHTEDHLKRLFHSLEVVGIDPGMSPQQFAEVTSELVSRNYPLLAQGDDLGVAIFITPGNSAALADGNAHGPRVGLHTFRLAFALWADKYASGERLAFTNTRQVPTECWPAELKCRSRMHYYLADREANEKSPGARALLLNIEGHVTEASTANLMIYRSAEGLIVPPKSHVLPGISLQVLTDLAESLDITVSERNLLPLDVEQADEVLLSSTPFCLLSVASVGEVTIGQGTPGPIYHQLLSAFSDLVGLDIEAQAVSFSSR